MKPCVQEALKLLILVYKPKKSKILILHLSYVERNEQSFLLFFVKNQAVANYRIKSKKGKYDEAEHHLIGIGGNVNR